MNNSYRLNPMRLLAYVLSIVLVLSTAVSAQVPVERPDVANQEADAGRKLLMEATESDSPKPIDVRPPREAFEQRLLRKITLDIRDMNIIDVVKFLAVKGDFNVVTSSTVEGRATLFLKSVAIKDALDIAVISNKLAYHIQNEIIQVMSEAEYEAMYGKKFSDKRLVEIIHLDYAKPAYVLSALDGMKSNIGKIVIDEDTGSVVLIDTPEAIGRMKVAIQSIEKPLEVFVYNLQYAKSDVVAEKLKARIDANSVGSITPNERSNQLMVRAFPGRRKEVEDLIRSLDQPTKEVLVEARVLQVQFNPKYDVGIDWEYDFSASNDRNLRKLRFENVFLGEDDLATADNLKSLFGKVAIGNVGVDHLTAAIRALRQVNDTKILSNPRILVTNNEEAKIHIGDTVPYIISTTSGTGDNAITSEDVRFVDVGLKLMVTPTINDDGFVLMRLKPEISTVTGTIDSQGGGIPQVNKTQVETSVLVKDGTTIIMGGLKKDEKTHVKKGFPILGDIPIVDKLFSRTSDSVLSTEIVIFITPHIVEPNEHYKEYKGDIKPSKTYGTEDLSSNANPSPNTIQGEN